MSKQGFGSIEKGRLLELCQQGGRKAHRIGKAHEWTRDEARIAGVKGGKERARRAKEKREKLLAELERSDKEKR